MIETYDPHQAPEPEEWLALHELDRIGLALEYHRRTGEPLPKPKLHAAIHAAVENQIALGDETPARATLHRLMDEGLDRHEAIHAIGFVLAGHMYYLTHDKPTEEDPNATYFKELEELTAKKWIQEASSLDEDASPRFRPQPSRWKRKSRKKKRRR